MVREDLGAGAILAQSCHAVVSFTQEHEVIAKQWVRDSNYIVVLAIPGESELATLIEKVKERQINYSVFREPDLDDQLTAICLSPGPKSKKICRNLKLALHNTTYRS